MDDWLQIVRQYSPLVRRTAYRLLGNHADTADCLQEVFISAIKTHGIDEACNWPGLLRRLATCRALDMLRQRMRRAETTSDLADLTGIPCTHRSPEQSAEDRDLAARLRQCLTQLPAQQAEVFCLACVEEVGHEEIAEQLGTTTGNVRILLHRARAKLRGLMTASQMPAEQ